MSPQDFRRMVLAWELTSQCMPSAGQDECYGAPDDLDQPSRHHPGSPAINQEQPPDA